MKIEYRRLTGKELNTFIDMRIKQLREEGAKVLYTPYGRWNIRVLACF